MLTNRKRERQKGSLPFLLWKNTGIKAMRKKRYNWLKKSMAVRIGNWLLFYRKKEIVIYMKKWDIIKPEKQRKLTIN